MGCGKNLFLFSYFEGIWIRLIDLFKSEALDNPNYEFF